jgi:hypothetical protein
MHAHSYTLRLPCTTANSRALMSTHRFIFAAALEQCCIKPLQYTCASGACVPPGHTAAQTKARGMFSIHAPSGPLPAKRQHGHRALLRRCTLCTAEVHRVHCQYLASAQQRTALLSGHLCIIGTSWSHLSGRTVLLIWYWRPGDLQTQVGLYCAQEVAVVP